MKARHLQRVPLFLLLGCLALSLSTCAPTVPLLQQTRTLGTLRVAMVNSATSYYSHGVGAAGFEYDLVREFAKAMELQLDVIVVPNQRAAIAAVRSGRAHMAAGLAVSAKRRRLVHFTPAYAHVSLDVVYNTDTPKPDGLQELQGQLTLQSSSVLGNRLAQLHPQLDFAEQDANPKMLMAQVAKGELFSTIANADLVAINQRYHPDLRVAFTLAEIKHRLAWAFPKTANAGLYNRAVAWLAHAYESGQIAVLRQCYFDPSERLGFVGGLIFAQQVQQRLPQWLSLFKLAGKTYDLDWQLLAAMSYQESHWNADAVSPTGVRGLMMLTQATAGQLGISDRLVPEQSIDGGARYLVKMRQRLPDSITEPDRTWMALAAYNIGFGHLMDARRLLKAQGRDPNLWANVRQALTWLTEKQYSDDTRYGTAPGDQALEYVDNIRAYYDMLNWLMRHHHKQKPVVVARTRQHDATLQAEISITSPAL